MPVDSYRVLPQCLSIAVERYHDVRRSLSSATTMSADRCRALPRCLPIAVKRYHDVCRSLSIAADRCRELFWLPQRGRLCPSGTSGVLSMSAGMAVRSCWRAGLAAHGGGLRGAACARCALPTGPGGQSMIDWGRHVLGHVPRRRPAGLGGRRCRGGPPQPVNRLLPTSVARPAHG